MSLICLILLLLPARPGSQEMEALRDPSRVVRERAIEALAASAQPTSGLLLLLHEEDPRVRRGVCEVLARRGDPVAIPSLLLDGSPAAADACVRIAHRCRLDLPEIATLATAPMREKIVRAHARAVHRHLDKMRGRLKLKRPQVHRALHAGGAWSAVILRRIAKDTEQPAKKRAHALHAAQLLIGRAQFSDLVALLNDPVPELRAAAITLLWRLHDVRGNRLLARLLDRGSRLTHGELYFVVSAVDQGGTPNAAGYDFLASLIGTAPAPLAADAAGALLRNDKKRAVPLLVARVKEELRSKSSAAAAIFYLRCGAPSAELAALAKDCKEPLVPLAAETDREKARKMLRAQLDPRRGSQEWIRVRVVTALLVRHNAPFEDRLRYARGVVDSDVADWRAGAFRLLRGAPQPLIDPLRPKLEAALQQPFESVRVNAAILLLPDAGAQRVLWTALYDGDLRTAWSAGPALDAGLDRHTPLAERRRQAREALAALDRK
ncbi:MAG: HEAT repeat domain-containing protein [Planctomycetota bacterium]|jgi:hypothetical protein